MVHFAAAFDQSALVLTVGIWARQPAGCIRRRAGVVFRVHGITGLASNGVSAIFTHGLDVK